MINTISDVLVNFLLKYSVINDTEDEKAHYKYGMEISISSLLNVFLICLLGCIFHRISFALIYIILFMTLRQITGGYHAKTYFKCNLIMCSTFSITLLITYLSMNIFNLWAFILHILISITVILILCPVSNENKPIKPESKNKFKITAAIVSSLLSLLGFLMYINSYDSGLFIIMTIIMINILIVLPSFMKRGEKNG